MNSGEYLGCHDVRIDVAAKAFDLIYIIIGVPFLFLNITTSRTFPIVKAVLLFFLCLVSVFELILLSSYNHSYAKFQKRHLAYVLVFVSYSLFSILVGIANDFPFSLDNEFALVEHYIFTPIIVLLLYEFIQPSFRRYQFLQSALKYISLFVAIGDFIAAVLIIFGTEMPYPLSLIFMTASEENTGVTMAIRVTNEAVLMFLVPLYTVMIFDNKAGKGDRLIYCLIFLFGTLYSLMSGRKMLEVVIFLACGFCFFWQLSKKSKNVLNKIFIVFLIALVVIISIYILSNFLNINVLEIAISTIVNGFSSSSRGVYGRVDNMMALLELWAQAPIIGNGLNSYSSGSLASHTTPWSYEIVYNALLAQTGVIGICILGIGIIYLLKKLYRSYKKTSNCIYLAFFVGFGCFLICGASNPLVYFVWVWAITLIVAESSSNYMELNGK